MLNVMLAGVGGQGTVLAAKVLAQAAQEKGWHVRTAETIGMAQRGGNVVSHVRMGNRGEQVYAPLIAEGTADLIIAFEPAEAARVLPYCAPGGVIVSASTAIQPVSAALSATPYVAQDVLDNLAECAPRVVAVDDVALVEQAGSRKALNTLLLATALEATDIGITIDDLKQALRDCVKERFVEMNLHAVEVAVEAARTATNNR